MLVDGEPVSASFFDFGLVLLPQRRSAARARFGPVLLPAEAREPPRGSPLERRLRAGGGTPRAAACIDPCHGAHRDDSRGLRDGRDPLGAARTFGRASTRGVGTTSSARSRTRRGRCFPGSRAGDHDRPLHAGVLGAACRDLPPARGVRDRRHGRFIPSRRDPAVNATALPRSGRTSSRVERRVRRHVGRAPGPRAGGDRGLRGRARAGAEPGRTARATTSTSPPSSCSTSRSTAGM